MQWTSSMSRTFKTVASCFGVFVLGTAFAPLANAGCADFQPIKKAVSWQTPGSYYGGLSFVRVSDEGDWRQRDDIVGMWRFTMTIAGPNGQPVVIDDGYNQWHVDGTEIMNSGGHAPITSNFCLGVWAQTGPGTYKLNHFPLAWDAAGTAPQGPVHFVANVKLKDHDHFSGPFTLDVYLWDGNEIINAMPGAPPLAHLTGTFSGTRVTTETGVPGAP
jgi:hypothetical protein